MAAPAVVTGGYILCRRIRRIFGEARKRHLRASTPTLKACASGAVTGTAPAISVATLEAAMASFDLTTAGRLSGRTTIETEPPHWSMALIPPSSVMIERSFFVLACYAVSDSQHLALGDRTEV